LTTFSSHRISSPLTSSNLGEAAAAYACAVLDSPAASAGPGEREVVAESLKRLAEALRAE
jgi:hypothetical protein